MITRLSASALLAAALVPAAIGAEVEWNVESGDFMDGANWLTGAVPGAGDDGVISNGGTATLSEGSATMFQLWVGNTLHGTKQGTLVQTGGSIRLTVGLVVGRQADSVGTYTMTGGTLTTGDFRVGGGPANTTSKGTMSVSGEGTSVTATGTTVGVGIAGEGTLTLSDSAVFTRTGGAVLIGSDNAISGASGGRGTLNVLNEAVLSVAGNLVMGRNPNSVGTIVVDGGHITSTGQINLGNTNGGTVGGTGTLTLNSGSVTGNILRIMEGSGTVNLNGGVLGVNSMFRSAANVSAKVNFNGATVRTSASGDFFSGFSNNELEIHSGGLIFDTNGQTVAFAQGFSGVGTFTKTGAGMLIMNGISDHTGGTLVDGGLLIVSPGATLGSGAITVAAGGSLDFDYDFTLTTAGLVLEVGSEFFLDQNLTFAGLTIAGDVFEEGVYSYETLEAEYGDIFADGGSGQITVTTVPEPSVIGLCGLAAATALWRIRRRG